MQAIIARLAAATLIAAALTGCSAGSTVTGVAGSITSAPVPLTSVRANLAITGPEGYHVQTLTAWNLSNIDHVTLALYRNDSGSYVATGATKTIANAALTSAVTLSNLEMGAGYKVVARAYADAAGTSEIDNIAQSGSDTGCSSTFTTASLVSSAGGDNVNDGTIALTIPVHLMNKTFAGQANDNTGVSVTNGTIVNTTTAETF